MSNNNNCCPLHFQIEGGRWQAAQLTTDYRGATSTASLTLGNVDIFNGSGLMVAHYLQQVTALALWWHITCSR